MKAPFLRLPSRAALAAACLALSGWWGSAVGAEGAGLAGQRPPAMVEVTRRALDDPGAALDVAAERIAAARAAGDRTAEAWLQLATVDVLVQADRQAEALRALRAVQALLEGARGAEADRQRRWAALYLRFASDTPADVDAFRREQAALREQARASGDEALACAVDRVDGWVFYELDATDESWAALEATERCAARLRDPGVRADALGAMGLLAGRVGAPQPAETWFERAIAVLGGEPARYKRAWLLDDLGWALLDRGAVDAARQRFEASLALALELGDLSSTMRGHEGLAEVLLKQGDGEGALRQARQSLRLGADAGLRFRAVTAQTQVVEALILLSRTEELAREVGVLKDMGRQDPSARTGALITRSTANGYRALGRWREAYGELERFLEFARITEKARRDREAQRLQARWETVRRDAENAELRRVADAARMELAVRNERLRTLASALVAALALLATGGWFLARTVRRRRRMADLALRDELTGLPNRRAMMAFAAEQFGVAQRVDLPLTVAFVDLDHFKQVNDRFGHACGDRVLQAFAQAAQGILRGQDRIGRWGGEEWLLVMPGTRAAEAPQVFQRLRESLAAQVVEGLPQGHRVTFSMGVAERGPGLETVEALIGEADRHLYEAKSRGRDALCGVPTTAAAGA